MPGTVLELLFHLSHVSNLIDGNRAVCDHGTIGIGSDKHQHSAQALAGVGVTAEPGTIVQEHIHQMRFVDAGQIGMNNRWESFPGPCPQRGTGVSSARDVEPFQFGPSQILQRRLLTPRPQDLIDPAFFRRLWVSWSFGE